MKAMIKKSAVAVLAGVLAAGSLAGCGKKAEEETAALDGTQVVATVNGTDLEMGVLSLGVREQQAQMEAMYQMYMGSSDIWDTPASDDSGETVGQQTVKEILKSVEQMILMEEHASEYGVEVSEENKAAMSEAAAKFLADNSEETIAELSVTQEQAERLLELQTYSQKMNEAIREEAEVEVSDAEAIQSSFSYVRVSASADGLSEEDKTAMQEKAQQILDQMQEDPEQDLEEVAAGIDDTLSVNTGSFTADETVEDTTSYPEALVSALRGLKDGEFAPEVIDASSDSTVVYYVARLDKVEDEDATASKRESLEDSQRTTYYNDKVAEWYDAAEINVNDDVLNTLTLTNGHKFTLVYPTAAETEGAIAEAETDGVVAETDGAVEDAE